MRQLKSAQWLKNTIGMEVLGITQGAQSGEVDKAQKQLVAKLKQMGVIVTGDGTHSSVEIRGTMIPAIKENIARAIEGPIQVTGVGFVHETERARALSKGRASKRIRKGANMARLAQKEATVQSQADSRAKSASVLPKQLTPASDMSQSIVRLSFSSTEDFEVAVRAYFDDELLSNFRIDTDDGETLLVPKTSIDRALSLGIQFSQD